MLAALNTAGDGKLAVVVNTKGHLIRVLMKGALVTTWKFVSSVVGDSQISLT